MPRAEGSEGFFFFSTVGNLMPLSSCFQHPGGLGVPVCMACVSAPSDDEGPKLPVDLEEDGCDDYCSFCGEEGGTLYLCDSCSGAFCSDCLGKVGALPSAEADSRWSCLLCDSSPLASFREALHRGLALNYRHPDYVATGEMCNDASGICGCSRCLAAASAVEALQEVESYIAQADEALADEDNAMWQEICNEYLGIFHDEDSIPAADHDVIESGSSLVERFECIVFSPTIGMDVSPTSAPGSLPKILGVHDGTKVMGVRRPAVGDRLERIGTESFPGRVVTEADLRSSFAAAVTARPVSLGFITKDSYEENWDAELVRLAREEYHNFKALWECKHELLVLHQEELQDRAEQIGVDVRSFYTRLREQDQESSKGGHAQEEEAKRNADRQLDSMSQLDYDDWARKHFGDGYDRRYEAHTVQDYKEDGGSDVEIEELQETQGRPKEASERAMQRAAAAEEDFMTKHRLKPKRKSEADDTMKGSLRKKKSSGKSTLPPKNGPGQDDSGSSADKRVHTNQEESRSPEDDGRGGGGHNCLDLLDLLKEDRL